MNNLENKVRYIKAINKGMEELAQLKGKSVTSIGKLLGVGTDSAYYQMATIAVKDMGAKSINKFDVEEYEDTLRIVALELLKIELA